MPKADRSTQINTVLKPETYKRLQAFLAERGQTLTHTVDKALTRHMDHPPPLAPDAPLPPCEPDPPPVKRGRKPKGGQS